jgi:hypothetical protein
MALKRPWKNRNDGFPSSGSGHLSFCVWGASESFEAHGSKSAGDWMVAMKNCGPAGERLVALRPGRLL